MVLQDLGDPSPPSDGFSDNPYPSDSDPYSSTTISSNRFDPSICAQPIPLIGPLIGYPERFIRYRTNATIKFAENKIGRAMTQEEAQALAGHLYQLESTLSYFSAVGVGLGAWRAWNTAAIYRFPFYTPKSVDPNKFGPVRGPLAPYARHSVRAMFFMYVGGEFAKLLGRILVQPTASRNTAEDPRLTVFSKDLENAGTIDRQKSIDMARARAEAYAKQRRENYGGQHDGQAEPPPAGTPNSWPQRQAPATDNQDDMSPASGNDAWPSTSDSNSSFSSDTSQDKPPAQPPYQRAQTGSSWGRQPRSSEADDASPTGGIFEDEVQNQSSRPGESAWDRLRRGGTPNPGPPPRRPELQRREPRRDSNSSDSFPFASGEDRSDAQAKAQQDFDARLQREREGKDFSDERRW